MYFIYYKKKLNAKNEIIIQNKNYNKLNKLYDLYKITDKFTTTKKKPSKI